MGRTVLLTNEYITVEYLEDKKIISHVVHKPVAGQMLLDALNTGTDALVKYGVCKWLSDDRLNGPVSEDEQAFLEWNQRTIKCGWKYWALVVPQKVADAGTLMPSMESLFKLGLRMMVFTSVEKAIEWLDQME
ncbi:MAG TPA: hypothetical protein VHP83_09735 [Aggregatilineaceae bacterium]|nr:hypothetical protein [Aggregatilineaceae bacterium]